jgi:outer membrane protein
MRKFLGLVLMGGLFFLLGFGSAARAEMKIGFMDVDKAVNESEEGKKALSGLKDFMEAKKIAFTEKLNNYEKMKADLAKQSSLISTEARKLKQDDIESLGRDLQRMEADAKQEFLKKRGELMEAIIKELSEVIEKVGSEGKYDAIYPPMLYYSKSLDITELVIKKFNELKGTKGEVKK